MWVHCVSPVVQCPVKCLGLGDWIGLYLLKERSASRVVGREHLPVQEVPTCKSTLNMPPLIMGMVLLAVICEAEVTGWSYRSASSW